MKKSLTGILLLAAIVVVVSSFQKEKHCVYRTLMNEDPVEVKPILVNQNEIHQSVQKGLEWLQKAQHENGGWGCGSHQFQKERNPLAVPPDPATTAIVSMALLRSGSTLTDGPYHRELSKATNYLFKVLKNCIPNAQNITELKNTQIQRKLGQNIDVVLTTQYLTNLMSSLSANDPKRKEIEKYLNLSVEKIQLAQNEDGSLKGGTWAGVLQSSFANSALESAQTLGIEMDEVKLQNSKKYQQGNYDLKTEEVSTSAGAGILLYSLSSTSRASAKEAKAARSSIERAIQNDLLSKDEKVNTKNLVIAGLDEEEAMELNASYQIYEASKVKAQRDDVQKGFGNNGGEEFLSFLQTGEALILGQDDSWANWYDNVSQRLLDIQNNDGSWNGHHCITSPVFCTATCISILTIQNDIDMLKGIGDEEKRSEEMRNGH